MDKTTPPRTNAIGSKQFDVCVAHADHPRCSRDEYRVSVERDFRPDDALGASLADAWHPVLSPSNELLRWFTFRKDQWYEFRRRYFLELEYESRLCEQLREQASCSALVLLYCQGSPAYNVAAALKQFLEQLECEHRWKAGWIVGGYSFPIRRAIVRQGGLWFPHHKVWVMPDRPSWEHIQSLLPGDF